MPDRAVSRPLSKRYRHDNFRLGPMGLAKSRIFWNHGKRRGLKRRIIELLLQFVALLECEAGPYASGINQFALFVNAKN